MSKLTKIVVLSALLGILGLRLSAQSGYIYPTDDLLRESQELFEGLNKGRLNGQLFMDLLSTSDCETILPQLREGKFVYVDPQTGKQKFRGEYDAAYPFNGDFALAVKDGREGIINRKGKWVIKPTDKAFKTLDENDMYLDARNGTFSYKMYVEVPAFPYKPVVRHGKWGILNGDKEVIPYIYDEIVAVDLYGFIALENEALVYIGIPTNEPLTDYTHVRLALTNEANGFNDLLYFSLYDADRKMWDYYKGSYAGLKKLFSVNHYGFNYKMGEFCVAKLKVGNQYNVLFEDGSRLPNSYQWITDMPSRQLVLAVDTDGKILIVNKQGDEFVVCE